MRGTVRWRFGAWRLRVDGGLDPITGKRRQIERTYKAPNNQKGERQAETELAKLIAEIEAHRLAPTSGLTVAQVIERYIVARSPDWAPGQDAATRKRVAQHITPHVGATAADKLRPIDVQHLVDRWRAVGVKPRRIFDILHAALAWAVRHQIIADNPAARVDKPAPGRGDVDPPPPSDVARLMAKAKPELAVFLRLAALTGARRGQLVALQWRDISLDAGSIRWTRALAKVPGGVAVKETKTGARWPVAIDPVTVEKLRTLRRLAVERSLAAGSPLPEDAYVFCRDAAGRLPWHPDGAYQRFVKLRKHLELDSVNLHDLRHWMATEGLGEGVDIETVAARGGWANTTTPLEIYSHFRPARDAELSRRLAARLDDQTG